MKDNPCVYFDKRNDHLSKSKVPNLDFLLLRKQIIPSKDTTFLSKVSPWGSLVQSNKFQIGLIEANNKGHLGNFLEQCLPSSEAAEG